MRYAPNRLTIAAIIASLLTFAQARASDNPADLHRLQRASQLVAADRARDAEEAAGLTEKTIPAIQALELDRFYRVGDHWKVLFAPKIQNLHNTIPASTSPSYSRPIAYDFKVTRVDRYTAANRVERRYAEIEVSIGDRRFEAALRRINAPTKITLVLNDLYRGLFKIYHFSKPRSDGATRVTVSLDGRTNITSGLDRFPIDLPNVSRANGYPTPSEPGIPDSLRNELRRERLLDPADALSFHYANNLGKKLEVIWSRRNPWPAYAGSNSGIAVLVSYERSSR